MNPLDRLQEYAETTRISMRALRTLGYSAYTLLATPPHLALHRELEQDSADIAQPLVSPISEQRAAIENLASTHDIKHSHGVYSYAELTHLASMLVQFSDHTGYRKDTIPHIPTFAGIEALKSSFVSEAFTNGPLEASQQLDIALAQTKGDMNRALMLLWAASRQYARWLDSALLPHDVASPDHRLDEMKEWRATLRAHKQHDALGPQDPSGDNYYMWTHAYAQYAWRVTPTHKTILTTCGAKVFALGTILMHAIVHNINAQSIPSNHVAAARYGNAIGDRIVDMSRTA